VNPKTEQPRRGLLAPTMAALLGVAVLLGLGTWQMERKVWKEGLIATLSERLSAPPAALPGRSAWPQLTAEGAEFRRVSFRAEFLNDREAFVYTAGSSLRPDVSGPGYWVFTPARLADGSLVVVDRGFVPEARRAADTRREGEVAGTVEIVGALRWPERPGLFTPAGDPAHNVWFARDHRAIADQKGWGAVAPFYVEQEAPPAPGGLPRVGRVQPVLPNNHLQYALTWYGLAAVLVGVFTVWMRGRRRERRIGAT
jgi:surfeit locus 1 family protein